MMHVFIPAKNANLTDSVDKHKWYFLGAISEEKLYPLIS